MKTRKLILFKNNMERNIFLEIDGLYFESETHEWFHDKTSTQYAQTNNGLNIDALENIHAFVVRKKSTGEYDRLLLDSNTNEVIFESKSFEAIAFYIDKLKVIKRFK